MVAVALEEAGYTVEKTSDTLDGLKRLYEDYPDLVIVARELPMVGGEDPCLRIRQASYLPIIVLGSGSTDETAEMLELGADAYMMKPPSLIELVARVHSLLRRKPWFDPTGGEHKLEIDASLSKGGNGGNGGNESNESDGLTATEYRLVSCLLFNRGILLGYQRLLNEVWGGKKVTLDTLHFYIRRLRAKLANLNIFGIRGVGYCLPGDSSQATQ